MESNQMKMFRRAFLVSLAAASFSGSYAQEVKEIRMLEAGGDTGEAVQAAFVEPFQKKTGIRVIRENPNLLGKIKAMVASKNITTPIVLVPRAWMAQAKAENLLEPLDWDAINPMPINPDARDSHGIGWSYFSTVIAWRTDVKPLNRRASR
ncbi:extracellular solute-binding protein [Ramlibacter sp. 2FC]|uniref:extracellular solute-binding protein n=1 Tax=Ramlibacter sp. 2FC TaxID=2502188 RepID=UPI0010F68D70|nr:extracellular solute-binding protein [Ramlibacter sp. 2FC]